MSTKRIVEELVTKFSYYVDKRSFREYNRYLKKAEAQATASSRRLKKIFERTATVGVPGVGAAGGKKGRKAGGYAAIQKAGGKFITQQARAQEAYEKALKRALSKQKKGLKLRYEDLKALKKYKKELDYKAAVEKRSLEILKQQDTLMRKLGRGAKKLTANLAQGMGKAAKYLGKKGLIGGLRLGGRAVRGALGAGKNVFDEFVGMSHEATKAAARFPTEFEAARVKIEKMAREIAKDTQFAAMNIASGIDFYAKAGWKLEEALGAIKPAVDLATIADVDLARAADIATDAMDALGFTASSTEEKIANYRKTTGLLGVTTISANVDLQTLFQTVKTSAPVADMAGVSVKNYLSAIGLLAGAGIKGTQASTALKNIFLRLQAPTAKAAGIMKDYKIEIDDGTGKMKTFVEILAHIKEQMAEATQTERVAALKEILGMPKNMLIGFGT